MSTGVRSALAVSIWTLAVSRNSPENEPLRDPLIGDRHVEIQPLQPFHEVTSDGISRAFLAVRRPEIAVGVPVAKQNVHDGQDRVRTASVALLRPVFLERERNDTIGTRNVRLAAFKSFFRYLEFRVPVCLDLARQVHAIPMKRRDEAMVESLNRDEVQVRLDAPTPTTAAGVRDRAMLHLTCTAGLRVSELIGLICTDLARPHLDTVRVTGKGRREHVLPLWQETRSALRDWLSVRPDSGHDHLHGARP